jgi:integrase/recombinase XerD
VPQGRYQGLSLFDAAFDLTWLTCLSSENGHLPGTLRSPVQITFAVHLLEAGVEVNVIRGWLGHADLKTTNRYAEINTKTKLAALQATEPHDTSPGPRTNPIWRSDQSLLNWLASL